MTTDEIKKTLAARGWTQAELAEKLGCNAKGLNEVLRGARPLTETMNRHIELLLRENDEAIFVYRINLTTEQVRELCGEQYTGAQEKDGNITLPPRARKAIELVIRHNLMRLAKLGAQWEGWSEEDRALLDALDREAADHNQLPPLPTAYGEAQEPFA